MTKKYRGVLEVDEERGVIYFHTDNPTVAGRYGTMTLVRVCRLRKPIQLPVDLTTGCNAEESPVQ